MPTSLELERNTESTARQCDLVDRAVALGWARDAIQVIDADLGVSGSALGQREGFESLVGRGRPGPGRDHLRVGGIPAGP
jgi:hypothetical protein